MSADIVKPFGDFGAPIGEDAGIIELLEETLIAAKAGEVAGIAMTVIRPNGCIKGDMRPGNRSAAEVLGALDYLHDDIMREWKSQ